MSNIWKSKLGFLLFSSILYAQVGQFPSPSAVPSAGFNLFSGSDYIFEFSTDLTNGSSNCEALFAINCDGASPGSVSSSPGLTPPSIDFEGINGGNTTISTTGVGGDGNVVFIISGSGGNATLAANNSTGGAGGPIVLQTGGGGNANNSANLGNNTGGGGAFFGVNAGNGGDAQNGTSNTGGIGGSFLFKVGSGGSGSTANGLDGIFRFRRGTKLNSDVQTWEVNDGSAIILKINKSGNIISGDASTTPTISGCTSAVIVSGSTAIAGEVNMTPTGTCVLTLTFGTAAPNGYNCAISNLTTANLIRQTAKTTTTAVFTGVTVANDVLSYGPCVGW